MSARWRCGQHKGEGRNEPLWRDRIRHDLLRLLPRIFLLILILLRQLRPSRLPTRRRWECSVLLLFLFTTRSDEIVDVHLLFSIHRHITRTSALSALLRPRHRLRSRLARRRWRRRRTGTRHLHPLPSSSPSRSPSPLPSLRWRTLPIFAVLIRIARVRVASLSRVELPLLLLRDFKDFLEKGESEDLLGRFGVALFDFLREAGFGVSGGESDEGFERSGGEGGCLREYEGEGGEE
jgi:hypothetical protein